MEHAFAQYIRTLGRGKRGMRNLTPEEAECAFGMILDGTALPMQIGAFLMLLRVKEETGLELSGFVRAARARLQVPSAAPAVNLDWSSYAGKRRQLPWFLLSALLLARNGVRVFMHGLNKRADERVYTPEALAALGIAPSASLADAARALDERNFAFCALESFSPQLAELIALRSTLGLRSPVNSLARMLNPFSAPHVMQGIFHPPYKMIHLEAGTLLGIPHLAVLKGEGGEIERNPDVPCEVATLHDGVQSTEAWPAMFALRHVKDETMDVARLPALWRGDLVDEYGEAAVVGTAAVALKLLQRADSIESAQALAQQWWAQRNKNEMPS